MRGGSVANDIRDRQCFSPRLNCSAPSSPVSAMGQKKGSSGKGKKVRKTEIGREPSPATNPVSYHGDRSRDHVMRGAILDELVVTVAGVLSPEECRRVDNLHRDVRSLGDDHHRDPTLDWGFELWRLEGELKERTPEIWSRLVGDLMQSVDEYYWQKLQVAHDETGKLRLIDECKRGKDKVLIRPEVEYIVYDADEAMRAGKSRPSHGPHTDNYSVVTMVCLLSDPSEFKGGFSCFCPASDATNAPPREYRLRQGEVVLFRGESCVHWITDITEGRRSILQIELALCVGKHDTPFSTDQATGKGKGKSRAEAREEMQLVRGKQWLADHRARTEEMPTVHCT